MTRCNAFKRLLTTSDTSTSFASTPDLATTPSGDGVIPLGGGVPATQSPDNLQLIFFGEGNDDTTFDVRVIGYRRTTNAAGDTSWTAIYLADISVTLCTETGISGGVVTASEKYADTLTVTLANENVDYTVVSPTGNRKAHVTIDTKGCEYAKVIFDRTGATACNCLWATL